MAITSQCPLVTPIELAVLYYERFTLFAEQSPPLVLLEISLLVCDVCLIVCICASVFVLCLFVFLF